MSCFSEIVRDDRIGRHKIKLKLGTSGYVSGVVAWPLDIYIGQVAVIPTL